MVVAGMRPGEIAKDAGRDGREAGSSMLPGLMLAVTIAGSAYSLRQVFQAQLLSPMIVAVLIGISFRAIVGVPARTRAGLSYAQRDILRFAIILFGFQLSLHQLADLGAKGAGVAVVATSATFLLTLRLGRWLGVERGLTTLIAAGTSICGASAIVATQSVERAKEEDVAYAIALVTLFGSVSMLLMPATAKLLAMAPDDTGLWMGASIHEVAQVVGASFQAGPEAGQTAVVAKLLRVLMLIPLVLVLTFRGRRERVGSDTPRLRHPWFVLWFLIVVCANSVFHVPAAVTDLSRSVTPALLTIGLAAVGLQADVSDLFSRGRLPLLLGFFSTLMITLTSLLLITLW